jgi:DNA-3-methyladenine glycosylase I
MNNLKRCGWVNLNNSIYIDYHDNEWGKPIHDDQQLFELICLEGAQAGVTWEMVLNKREEYRKCFWNFDVNILITKSDEELLARIQEFGVIKNRLKTIGVKKNAIAFNKIIRDHGSFDQYLWGFVDNQPIVNSWDNYRDAPTQTPLSTNLSKSLKKYGFSFIGPVICYAFMQSCGMVEDHEKSCYCRKR